MMSHNFWEWVISYKKTVKIQQLQKWPWVSEYWPQDFTKREFAIYAAKEICCIQNMLHNQMTALLELWWDSNFIPQNSKSENFLVFSDSKILFWKKFESHLRLNLKNHLVLTLKTSIILKLWTISPHYLNMRYYVSV